MRRRSYCTLAPPSGPGVQENIAAGLSWNAWLGGRDAQSIAFLSAAVREKLCSGHAKSRPSAAAISLRSRFTGSGMPASNTSWLYIGMSPRLAMCSVMPGGISSGQARSAAMLKDALRRLPQMPRTFMAFALAALGQVRDHGLQPCLVVGQGAQLGERFAPGLAPALDDPGLALLLVREFQANAVRVEEVDRIGLAADIDRAEILDARVPDSVQYVVELLLADCERHMLHRADRVAVAPRLGALRDLEEGEQRIAARIEKVVADVLERRGGPGFPAGPPGPRGATCPPPQATRAARAENPAAPPLVRECRPGGPP